jgi:hypothetical protein
VELDPGSKGTRLWIGLGAGAARVRVRAELVDLASGETLATFETAARHGKPTAEDETFYMSSRGVYVAYHLNPGDYDEVLTKVVAKAGWQVRRFLESFR